MKCFVIAIFIFCLFEMQNTNAKSCVYREPCVYQTCGCPATPSGVVTCATCNSCSIPTSSALCNCGGCSSCFRDTKDPCNSCEEKPSPVCSCLKSVNTDCECESARAFVFFPEVEYPLMALEMNPFYFTNCWSY